jgi:hypothetical protein
MAVRKGPQKRGPKPRSLKLEGLWTDRLREAIRKARPAGGWPKPGKMKRPDEKDETH